MRLQRLKLANGAIQRNAMDAAFPYIGDDAYGNCTAIVAALGAATGATAGETMVSVCCGCLPPPG